MSLIVIAEFRARDAAASDLIDALLASLPDTYAYEGIEEISLRQNRDHDDEFIVLQRWVSYDSYDAYAQRWAQSVAARRIQTLVAEPIVVRSFDEKVAFARPIERTLEDIPLTPPPELLRVLRSGGPFDLDRAFGVPNGESSRLYAFPPADYKARRVGWDCHHNALLTRGCEAERTADGWKMTHFCSLHEGRAGPGSLPDD
jgi:quinol monooxygenase YgiN